MKPDSWTSTGEQIALGFRTARLGSVKDELTDNPRRKANPATNNEISRLRINYKKKKER